MELDEFDEVGFYAAIQESGARALLIGRRALVALGLPVMTFDYDLWLHIDDMERLNRAVEPLDLHPSRSPEEARRFGRYVLENHEHVDVLIAREVSTTERVRVAFDEVWQRRRSLNVAPGVSIDMPCIDDLIATKKFGSRAKDLEDIRMLTALKERLG